ncbi:MAG: hypothetical protein HOC23_06015 [Halieaceae bacterium]|nr:hypothetical protein [Halieaceae bacterium]
MLNSGAQTDPRDTRHAQRVILATLLWGLAFICSPVSAAQVEYQPPNLTIIASNEPLSSVLRSIGASMRISVSTPPDLNPVVNCNIVNLPVKRAIKNLLGELSYALQWQEGGERLAGLIILENGYGPSIMVNQDTSPAPIEQVDSEQISPSGNSMLPDKPARPTTPPRSRVDHATHLAEQKSRMASDRAKYEARMAQEMEELEIRMAEEKEREDARMAQEMAEEEARVEMEAASQSFDEPDY